MTFIIQMQTLLLLILLYYISIVYSSSTCSKTSPCTNGACCSQWGSCGHGPDFCGDKCLSNCQSKSQCGKYGKSEKCPLNVCCSEFGFCGTTEDFCLKTKKCQNNCGDVKLPSCSSNSGRQLLEIGYYASWAAHRDCHAYKVKNIDPRHYTHLNYAFGSISKGLMIDPQTDDEISEIKQFTSLKEINPSLKVLISVGGWAFNDPGPTRHEFHNIISTRNARQQFIESVRKYLMKYNFDGIDIDYEYPAAEDRGGSPEDTDNYVQLVKEMRNEFSEKYLITIAAPASYWYLRHFKIGEMSKYLDFINVMTYDIHGVWNRDIKSLGPYVQSHTNIKEAEQAFELFLRDGVDSEKLTFGLGYYGRSFTLEKSSCDHAGCKFSGPGDAGRCTNSSGTLAWFEIEEIIAKNDQKTLKLDSPSMSKILTWGNNQWVAYDDEETLAMRRQYAREHCLKGVMIWSIDQGLNRRSDHVDENTCTQAEGVQNPFYIISHMANTIISLDWAVSQGANAIESDLKFDDNGNPTIFEHGGICDCVCALGKDHVCMPLAGACSGSAASENAAAHMRHVALLPNITLYFIDSKVDSKMGATLAKAGTALIPFIDKNLFDFGYKGKVIVGSGKVETFDYIRAAALAAKTSSNVDRYFFTFDQEGNDYLGVTEMLSRFTKNRVFGTGISSCAPGKYHKGIESAVAGKKKCETGMSYIWTLDKESSMRDYIELGVQGVMTNNVRKLRKLAESMKLRIAVPSDQISISVTSIGPHQNCDCNHHAGGCVISWPPPSGKACKCTYKGAWTCGGSIVDCNNPNSLFCTTPDLSPGTCILGGGDCGGYPDNQGCDCSYKGKGFLRSSGCKITRAASPGIACKCSYKGGWTCGGSLVSCDASKSKCANPDTSEEACQLGGGDCKGY